MPSRTSTLRRAVSIAATLSVVALSTGCSSQLPASTTTTVAPHVMTVEEAGEYYLNTVCPANASQDPWLDTANALYNAGGVGDLTPVTEAAAAARDAHRLAAERLVDPMVIWPDSVRSDTVIISDSYFVRVGEYGLAAAAASYTELINVPQTIETPEVAAAAPRLRAKLGLSSDAVGSCAGHE